MLLVFSHWKPFIMSLNHFISLDAFTNLTKALTPRVQSVRPRALLNAAAAAMVGVCPLHSSSSVASDLKRLSKKAFWVLSVG